MVTAVSLIAGAGVALQQARLARRQAAIAERRFGEVRKLANRFLFDFDAAIATVPGTTKAREMVVSTALEYLNRLSAEARGDAGLMEELAAAYQKVGDVQGNPSDASLGQTRAALESYRRSREIREQLLAARPGDAGNLRRLADLWLLEGSVERTLGQAKASGESIRKGAELADRALALKPDDPGLLFLVGSAWYRRGEDRRAFANGPEAQAAFERAAVTFRRVSGQPRFENALASTEGRLGFTLLEQGRPEEALGHMRTAVEIRRRLAAIQPPVTTYRRGLAIALLQLGNAYGTPLAISLGDERAAERCYRESIALFEELARQDAHNRTIQDDLLLVRLSLGAVLPAREAVRVFGEAIETMERSGVDTTRTDIRENLALARLGLARALVETGRGAGGGIAHGAGDGGGEAGAHVELQSGVGRGAGGEDPAGRGAAGGGAGRVGSRAGGVQRADAGGVRVRGTAGSGGATGGGWRAWFRAKRVSGWRGSGRCGRSGSGAMGMHRWRGAGWKHWRARRLARGGYNHSLCRMSPGCWGLGAGATGRLWRRSRRWSTRSFIDWRRAICGASGRGTRCSRRC